MKELFNHKKETITMIIVLSFYGVIAGGSLDGLFFGAIVVGAIVVIGIIWGIISAIIESSNKKSRINQKKMFEESFKDFDLKNKIGDEKCTLYFDNSKESVLIASISPSNIEKHQIDNFKKDEASYGYNTACAIDSGKRKALLITDNAASAQNITIIDYSENDNNKDIVSKNTIKPLFRRLTCKEYATITCSDILLSYILVEESFGYITIFKGNKIRKSFNYISKDYILYKKDLTNNSAAIRTAGPYAFILDDYFKVLTIVTPNTHYILNYSDIINITYEEDGKTLFSRNTSRTVGGTLVGGALLGGAGAIVGGLSGNTAESKIVKSMSLKILVRSTKNPTISLPISFNNEEFNTKDAPVKSAYDTRLKWANEIKDLISVVIDEGINRPFNKKPQNIIQESHIIENKQNMSVADELLKLSHLKNEGILSEEEFNIQKARLLK